VTFFSDIITNKSKTAGVILRGLQFAAQLIFYFLMFYYGAKLTMMAVGKVSMGARYPFWLIYLPIPIGAFSGCVNILLKTIRYFMPKVTGKGVKEGGEADAT
jgi:TRAP-type C4-dicarboxylate transport system permease small subunit